MLAGIGAFIPSAPALAAHAPSAQLCTVGAAAVGQIGTLICRDVASGVMTQAVPLGPTVAAAGGIAASLASRGDRVLVTNQMGGALLFRATNGRLHDPVVLQTDGEGSLSGAVSDRGVYVLTGTKLRFYPNGRTTATSSQPLLLGDGSAAAVTLANRAAYVSEKNGSLEAFALGGDGRLAAAPVAVSGISPGVIVGITGLDDLVVAPIAHLASNPNQSEISVVSGTSQAQRVPTKEVAACWASNDGQDEVCVANPGSMTVSCGLAGDDALESYTSAAASLPGESVFDLDMTRDLVGIQGIDGGKPVLLTFRRGDGDFLTAQSEFQVGTTVAAGALFLPSMN
ncbi:MAG TPA: hypothetical protein VMI54_24580 [Polyangiaceae bacterium]|nr:hypothetical protein [Polyangiaceae bacterium]